jgi:hypothetical protein
VQLPTSIMGANAAHLEMDIGDAEATAQLVHQGTRAILDAAQSAGFQRVLQIGKASFRGGGGRETFEAADGVAPQIASLRALRELVEVRGERTLGRLRRRSGNFSVVCDGTAILDAIFLPCWSGFLTVVPFFILQPRL